MIEAAFAGLSPADRDLLAAASVMGAEFVAQAIAPVLQRSVESVEITCEGLARAGRFLRFVGGTDWPDGSVALRYAFGHELYRRAVYESLPGDTRRRLHGRIGKALEAAYGRDGDARAAELAGHFERAGDVPRTVRWLAAAAESARHRFASREAAQYLQAGIVASARLADPVEAERQELALRLALGPVLNGLRGTGPNETAENGERARRLGDRVGTPEQRFWVLYGLAHVYINRADAERSAEVVGGAERCSRSTWAPPKARLLAASVQARAAFYAAHFAEACALTEHGPLTEAFG